MCVGACSLAAFSDSRPIHSHSIGHTDVLLNLPVMPIPLTKLLCPPFVCCMMMSTGARCATPRVALPRQAQLRSSPWSSTCCISCTQLAPMANESSVTDASVTTCHTFGRGQKAHQHCLEEERCLVGCQSFCSGLCPLEVSG